MKKLIIFSFILILTSCAQSTDADVNGNVSDAKFVIRVDDGTNQGLLSITRHYATYYRTDGGGVYFTTTDGKKHYTNCKVNIVEL